MKKVIFIVLTLLLSISMISCYQRPKIKETTQNDADIPKMASNKKSAGKESKSAVQTSQIKSIEEVWGDEFEKYLTGSINNNLNIHMKLKKDPRMAVSDGAYFYDKYKKNILLKGEDGENGIDIIEMPSKYENSVLQYEPAKASLKSNGIYILVEFDDEGKVSGVFNIKTLSKSRIEGEWQTKDGKTSYSFYLNVVDKDAYDSTAGFSKNGWSGTWHIPSKSKFFFTELGIDNAFDNTFEFSIETYNGSHMGSIEGIARVKGNHALFKDIEGGFRLEFNKHDNVISVEQSGNNIYAGAGAGFSGEYIPGEWDYKQTSLKDSGVFDTQEEEQNFKNLVREDYDTFKDYFYIVQETEDLDGFGAKAYTGGVRGLYTINEAIIMYNRKGDLWAALLDNDKVNYYTNTSQKDTLPKTIENWRSRFKDIPIVFMNK